MARNLKHSEKRQHEKTMRREVERQRKLGTLMPTTDATKIVRLQRQLDEERRRRLLLEQRLAGTRSALLRLQAQLAQQRAEQPAAKADAAQQHAD